MVAQAKAAIEQAQDVATLESVRVEIFRQSAISLLQMKTLRDLPAEERPAAGAVINEAKVQVQDALNARKDTMQAEILNARLVSEKLMCHYLGVVWKMVGYIQ